jgi:cytochrome oxidase assembly protein ShyY1
MKRAIFGPKSIALTLTAILLILGCFALAQWQWDRKSARDIANSLIERNINQAPAQIGEFLKVDNAPDPQVRWRHAEVSGTLGDYLLMRNRYSLGKYGYGVMAPITTAKGDRYWIDLGWIPAGLSATDLPHISLPTTAISVLGRIRGGDTLDRPGPRGSLFGTSTEDFSAVAKTINRKRLTNDGGGYLEAETITPTSTSMPIPIPTPEISSGPHAAYAVQWFIFAMLIGLGRFLLLREDIRSSKTVARKARDKGRDLS